MFFVMHISSYAHRIIPQDDNGDDVQQARIYHEKLDFSFIFIKQEVRFHPVLHHNDENTFLFPPFPAGK